MRVHRGVFLSTEVWSRLTATDRYTYRVLGAVAGARFPLIVSHISAAVLWGAPVIGPMPALIHVRTTVADGTRSEHGFRKHASPDPWEGVDERGELRMSGLARMLAEVASDSPFVTAVGVIDWALAEKGIAKEEILDALDLMRITRGVRAAKRAIAFADARSGSAGESLSRVRMHEAGLLAPELQIPFFDAGGKIGVVDFFWRDLELIGEFDGVSKYIRDDFTEGRSPEEIVIAEKVREDRLRATGPRVLRWDWSVAWAPYALQARLRAAGVPSNRRDIRYP